MTRAIDDWVIDADTHITEPGDVWTARLPARFQDDAPRIVRDDDGRDSWVFGTSERIVPIGVTAVAGWPEPFPASPKNMDEIPAAAHDATARLEYMDEIGVWACALYPNIGGFGSESFLSLPDPELKLACVRAYNDWLLDWISPAPERFIPIMAIPYWDLDAAVAEIERGAALGHRGILFTGEPQEFGLPYLGDRHWDPLWAAAADTGLPVSFHIGSGDFTKDFAMERIVAHGVGPTTGRATISLFLKNAAQVTDLLLCGVLPRFPDTRFVSVESGVGWVPFVLESADYTFEYSNVARERPEFTMKPSEYFHRQVYACYFYEEHSVRHDLDAIGVDNVLFETDYPHPVCLYGNVREKIEGGLSMRTDSEAKQLLWSNSADLYRVEPPDRPWPGASAS
jgi:predicted TIM-barrel fold metal-dependent hydrolase